MSKFTEFDLIGMEELEEEIIGADIESEDLGHLYTNNLIIEKIMAIQAKQLSERSNSMQYRVALSFAGENRNYANELAELLRDKGIEVFYDEYEKANLWGKDLYQHLQKVYRDDADFCVVFLSEHYANKLWTKHELKQAQARAFRESREYILPVKIDDTEIPGINETVGYLDLRDIEIQEVGELLVEKLRQNQSTS